MSILRDRRSILRMGSAVGLSTALLAGRNTANASRPAPSCPEGTTFKRGRFYSETRNYEININIMKNIGSGKIVVPTTVHLYDLECEPSPPPPPPPKPPRPKGTGLFDSYVHMLDRGMLRIGGYEPFSSDFEARMNFSASLYWDVAIPSFVTLEASSPVLVATADLPNGTRVSSTHGLQRSGVGYGLANPGLLASWLSTAAVSAHRGGFELSGLTLGAHADGADNFGVALYVGDYPVCGRASAVTATGFARSSGTRLIHQ